MIYDHTPEEIEILSGFASFQLYGEHPDDEELKAKAMAFLNSPLPDIEPEEEEPGTDQEGPRKVTATEEITLFEFALRRIEKLRIDKLKGNPKEILKAAKKITEDAILFGYNRAEEYFLLWTRNNQKEFTTWEGIPEGETMPREPKEIYIHPVTEEDLKIKYFDIVSVTTYKTRIEWLKDSMENAYKENRDIKPRVLMNADSLITAINNCVLAPYYDALGDHEDAKQELRAYVKRRVKTSTFTTPEDARRGIFPDIERYLLLNDAEQLKAFKTPEKTCCEIFPADEILGQKLDGQQYMNWRFPKNDKADSYYITISMSFENSANRLLRASNKVTDFDIRVLEALTNIYKLFKKRGEKPFATTEEICRTMKGRNKKGRNSAPDFIQKVRASIDKLRFTRIVMDISGELEHTDLKFNDSRVTNGIVDANFIHADWSMAVNEKGNRLEGYIIHEMPILSAYYIAKKQVLYIPYDIFDVSDQIPKTRRHEIVLGFTAYLVRRIAWMNSDGTQPAKILLKTLYEDTAIPTPDKIEERRALEDQDEPKAITEKTEGTRQNSKSKIKDSSRAVIISREKKRDTEIIEKILASFKGENKKFIKDYKITDEYIEITRNPDYIVTEAIDFWESRGTITHYENDADSPELVKIYTEPSNKGLLKEIKTKLDNWISWGYIEGYNMIHPTKGQKTTIGAAIKKIQ